MAATYYSILTNNGKALIANATVNTKVGLSDIAVGDGNGAVPTPLETRTTLVNEKARFACNRIAINANNSNWIEAEIIIPTTSGGYTIRELGLYAGATLVAVANFPSTYKPLETEGGAREIAIKMVINVQNAEVISVTLDNSLIYATRDWVNTYYIPRTDIVDNLTTNDAAKPVSAKQVKVLQDNKLDKTENAVSASKLLTSRKIGNVSFDGTADIDLATVITVTTDFNNITKSGTYAICVSPNQNSPILGWGVLEVIGSEASSSNARILQRFTRDYDTLMSCYERLKKGAIWGGWVQCAYTSSTVAAAAKLETARKINDVNFDGTQAIVITARPSVIALVSGADLNSYSNLTDVGEYRAVTTAVAGSLLNSPTGTAFTMSITAHAGVTQTIRQYHSDGVAGNAKQWYRNFYGGTWSQWYRIYDELNPQPNAATATKLATARKISGVSFDGTADIDLQNGTTSVAGILKLVNDLTTGGTDKALTAEQGKILNAAMFGVGQTWQDLTASRALNTTYTNTTGKTIFVVMSFTVTNNYDLTKIVVGGLELTGPLEYGGGGIIPCLSFPVPNNTSYAVTAAYGAVNKWSEFR